jgi:hypothetical protein
MIVPAKTGERTGSSIGSSLRLEGEVEPSWEFIHNEAVSALTVLSVYGLL